MINRVSLQNMMRPIFETLHPGLQLTVDAEVYSQCKDLQHQQANRATEVQDEQR